MGWGGRLLTFSAFKMGAYSRWALIRGWALIRINTVTNFVMLATISSTDLFRAAIPSSITFCFSSKSWLVFSSFYVTTPQTDMYSTSSFLNLYSSKLHLSNLPYSLSIRSKSLLKQEVMKRDLITFSRQICKIFEIVLFKHPMLFKHP